MRAASPNAAKSQLESKNSIVGQLDTWRTVRWESFSAMSPNMGMHSLIVTCMYQKTGSMIVNGAERLGSLTQCNFTRSGSWLSICSNGQGRLACPLIGL